MSGRFFTTRALRVHRFTKFLVCLSVLSALVVKSATAQSPCGTHLPQELQSWWSARLATLQTTSARPTSTLYVPVQFHLVGTDSGAGAFPHYDAYRLLCELNTRFAPLNMRFFMEAPPRTISNTLYYNPTLPYINAMANAHNSPRACNIYLVNNMAGICGLAYFPGSGPVGGRGAVVIKKSCAGEGSVTITHEVGHYFSLPHTFEDWDGPNAEAVDGSNCATKGDGFCDTRADHLDYRWTCPYTGTATDFNGDAYHPDSSLYMGYSIEPCPQRFSGEQQAAILFSRATDRSYLDSVAVPADFAPASVALISPADGSGSVGHSGTLFSWTTSTSPVEYNLRIRPASATDWSAPTVNLFTTTTSAVVEGLTPGEAYAWKVIPLSPYGSCTPPDSVVSEVRTFSAVLGAGDVREPCLMRLEASAGWMGDRSSPGLALNACASGTVRLRLLDAGGRTLWSEEKAVVEGVQRIQFPVAPLPPGVYVVLVTAAGQTAAVKLVL